MQFVIDRQVLSSRNPRMSELLAQQRSSFGEAVKNLTAKLGDENAARVLVATARNSVIELQDVFRCKNVHYTIADGGAVSIEFDAENYIEVRADAVNPTPPKTSAAPTGKST